MLTAVVHRGCPANAPAREVLATRFSVILRRTSNQRHCVWGIENSLRWVLDMIFRDDECRVRTDHAPPISPTIKHVALWAPGKASFRLKRKIAAWDDNFLANLIAAA